MSQRPPYTLVFTLCALLTGIWIFQRSPWLSPNRSGAAKSTEPRYTVAWKEGDAQTNAPCMPALFEGSVALANPMVAREVHIAPEKQEQIKKLVVALEEQTARILQESVRQWKVEGGFTQNRMPELVTTPAHRRKEILALKTDTEREIIALLSNDERQRWQAFQSGAFGERYASRKILPVVN